EQSSISILITNGRGEVEYANPKFEITSGYTLQELSGKVPAHLYPNNDKNRETLQDLRKRLEAGRQWSGELQKRRKDGTLFWEAVTITPNPNNNNTIRYHLATADDITDRLKIEMALHHSQKMDAVGELSGGLAHDFNNILGIIMGNLELLKKRLLTQPAELKRVENAIAGTERGAQLTQKLLSFSRTQMGQREVCDINDNVEQILQLISSSIPPHITLERDLQQPLWTVKVNSGELQDAVLNLILNARDELSRQNNGIIAITTANKSLDETALRAHPKLRVGDYVMIAVTDNGNGITPEIQEQMFTPFFSTKGHGKGTGLGLSMVYGFVQRSMGAIEIQTHPRKGSSFYLYLPRLQQETPTPPEVTPRTLPESRNTPRVLIVEDERELLEVATTYLTDLGYSTLTASGYSEALEILQQQQNIDILFSDVILSEQHSGFDLALEAHRLYPNLKIQLTSGFIPDRKGVATTSPQDQTLITKLTATLLRKPYTQSSLNEAFYHLMTDIEP
ncbi:MAG: PAS domain S-box protein, partial [Gammaproteobacteria bacterium]|nr:PAS domain S-box protein [Gammaproteobacteria bacterium]